jgi:multidrug resistance protein MdtO
MSTSAPPMSGTGPARLEPQGFFAWFGEFLRDELAPYPGRMGTVSRMVIAATLTSILIMTFRIPECAYGCYYVLAVSRDNLQSTVRSGLELVVTFCLGVIFVILGAKLFADQPVTHLLWVMGSIFVAFYALRALTNYRAASAFALFVGAALPLWYLPHRAEIALERTLWLALGVALGITTSIAVETVYYSLHPKDELEQGLDTRWSAVQCLLESLQAGIPPSSKIQRHLAQHAMVGLSRLRRVLSRSDLGPQAKAQRNALLALTGRLIDMSAAMAQGSSELSADDRARVAVVLRKITYLRHHGKPELPSDREVTGRSYAPSAALPLLPELEWTVDLLPNVFTRTEFLELYLPAALEESSQSKLLVADAFNNREHLSFAFSGCLAATLCYIIYAAIDWPGLSTSVTTCVLTALANSGSSRQKQLLRITGAIVGGLLFGIGSQIFILPNIDSIAGFSVLFAAVTAIAAYIATSSARLSYFGLQIALAFYLVNVQSFTIDTNLAVARDRVMGVLLGLAMMWLMFDRFWAKSAANAMVEDFIASIGMLADLAGISTEADQQQSIRRIRSLRDKINNKLDNVRAQADAIPFEFGARRAQQMALRAQIRDWLPLLRTLFLIEVALLQYRVYGASDHLPAEIVEEQKTFNYACAAHLDQLKNRLLGNSSEISTQKNTSEPLTKLEASLNQLLQDSERRKHWARISGLQMLSRQAAEVLKFLDRDMLREFTPAQNGTTPGYLFRSKS